MGDLLSELEPLLQTAPTSGARVVVLTGAGISAESGIPTFRGEEGYWQVGSQNYHPQEMATRAAFERMPDEVWAWYLYRRSVCLLAEPNGAHQSVVELERRLGDRFVLITQNVDGLHLRAGSSMQRTYQIHGNIHQMRCADECSLALLPIPAGVDERWQRGRSVCDEERALLRCPRCDGRSRPHVLWFDECYDEARFRFESSIRAATEADVLVVVGTAGQTNLPMQVGALVTQRGAVMIVVNPEPSPFTAMAHRNPRGLFLEGTAGRFMGPLMERLSQL